jgi:hypothetical protein
MIPSGVVSRFFFTASNRLCAVEGAVGELDGVVTGGNAVVGYGVGFGLGTIGRFVGGEFGGMGGRVGRFSGAIVGGTAVIAYGVGPGVSGMG